MNNLIFGWIAIPISILLGLAMTNPLSAQEAGMEENNAKFITEEIPVRGVCKMCKKRIEGAAMVPGVKLAQWSQNEQMLTVTFK
ncbi:MAG TPA: hypothetical protein VJ917_00210, partial [Saprospiraceae bacterium]|nr:hypothetical protein [Saprospiraceae bacterium]